MIHGAENITQVLTDSGCPYWRLKAGNAVIREYGSTNSTVADSVTQFKKTLSILGAGDYKLEYTDKRKVVKGKNETNWQNGYFSAEFEIAPIANAGNGQAATIGNPAVPIGSRVLNDDEIDAIVEKRLAKEKQILELQADVKALKNDKFDWSPLINAVVPALLSPAQQKTAIAKTTGFPDSSLRGTPKQSSAVQTETTMNDHDDEKMQAELQVQIDALAAKCNNDWELLILRLQRLNEKLDENPGLMAILDS